MSTACCPVGKEGLIPGDKGDGAGGWTLIYVSCQVSVHIYNNSAIGLRSLHFLPLPQYISMDTAYKGLLFYLTNIFFTSRRACGFPAGHDNKSADRKLITMCVWERARPLKIISNTATLPSDWKKAIVFLIYKGDGRSAVTNYRPISLTTVVCNQLEQL
jgi:hypothetical protein